MQQSPTTHMQQSPEKKRKITEDSEEEQSLSEILCALEDKQTERFENAFKFFQSRLFTKIPFLDRFDGSNSKVDDYPFMFTKPAKILGDKKVEVCKTLIYDPDTVEAMVKEGFSIVIVMNFRGQLDFDDCEVLFVSADDFIDAKMQTGDTESDPDVLFGCLTENAMEARKEGKSYTLKDFEYYKNEITESFSEKWQKKMQRQENKQQIIFRVTSPEVKGVNTMYVRLKKEDTMWKLKELVERRMNIDDEDVDIYLKIREFRINDTDDPFTFKELMEEARLSEDTANLNAEVRFARGKEIYTDTLTKTQK